MITKINNQLPISTPNFKANISSPVLRYTNEDFFISIRGYGKNTEWAKTIKQTADTAVNLTRKKCGFDNIIRFITAGVIKANNLLLDRNKKCHTGILRTEREGYKYGSDWNWSNGFLVTGYENISKYKTYKSRLDQTIQNSLKKPYQNMDLTVPVKSDSGNFLKHGDSEKVNSSLNIVKELFDKLIEKYDPAKVTEKDLANINNTIAEIRWIMAHSTPWERGSDAISNVFMRVLYKTFGIKTYPSAKGISFDMEAFCTNLNEYKQNFPNFFVKPPSVIE